MRAFLDIAFIAAASFAFGAANFALNPNRPNLASQIGEISLPDLHKIKPPVLVVDARSAADYERGHIKGAFNLPESQFDSRLGDFLDKWTSESSILVYCNIGKCNSSRIVAERLKKECGMQNVFVLKGDWTEWKKSEN